MPSDEKLNAAQKQIKELFKDDYAKTDAAGPLEKLTVVTEPGRPDALLLTLNAGSALAGKLAFAREDGNWRFQKGKIDFGRGPMTLRRSLSARSLHLSQRTPPPRAFQ